MAEYCEKCLIKIMGLSPKEAKKAVKIYQKDEQDLCEGCGKIVIMRNFWKKGLSRNAGNYEAKRNI